MGARREGAPFRPADPRSRPQPDPGRRPLLRLHGRPGFELRRRSRGSRRMNAPARTGSSGSAAGRNCPLDYTYDPAVFARPADFSAQVLYVVGGLYGNLPAAHAIERLAGAERADVVV